MIGTRTSPKAGFSTGCCWGCNLVRNMRFSRLILFAVLFLVGMVVIFKYWPDENLSNAGRGATGSGSFVHSENAGTGHDPAIDLARKTLGLIEWTQLSGPELHKRLEELVRIKHSVQNELRTLESQKSDMQLQVTDLTKRIDSMKAEANRYQYEMEKLKVSISQAKLAVQELAERNTPEILPPLRLTALNSTYPSKNLPVVTNDQCDMTNCFEWSRCPISSGFPVYLYHPNQVPDWFKNAVDQSGYRTNDPDQACIYITTSTFASKSLEFWRGTGRNHLVFDLGSLTSDSTEAMIASPKSKTRKSFDFLIPTFGLLEEDSSNLWRSLPAMIPLRRKYLYTFQTYRQSKTKVHDVLRESLEAVNFDRTDDRVSVNFTCQNPVDPSIDEWNLCGDSERRKAVLLQSTFAIILHEDTQDKSLFSTRLTEALQQGSIPVIICISKDCTDLTEVLPFSEVIDYRKFSLRLPMARIPELHFILRSIPDSDLFALRNQGRQIWMNYLGSGTNVLLSVLNNLRSRIGLPAAPFKDTPSPQIFDESNPPLMMDQLPSMDMDPGESLGPLEPPNPSPKFRRNFSSMAVDSYDHWNTHWGAAFRLAPQTPWDSVLPTDAKFFGSGSGFRPINRGEGGSGKEFSQALGGNLPQEHFTVVMLTYRREQVLIDSLSRLYGLPYLNKVIVVWNNPDQPPAEDLRWPDIQVPIVVIKTEKNSLNNRFLPFDEIDTEAVLSVDDDAHLRHDEIIFGFRVWREHRDRLVGFPGRFHAWDTNGISWNYNSNYSCELSMVLTGAAFFHKYYSYAYTELMPSAIREKVDEYMNCEDLAMNFLISHLTRQPPVKVTSRWTFRCPGCPVTLSEDDSHFQERHKCINFFSQVFGYMPLLYTQYRADSVLFKTRIPQDKQKCFKFI